MCPKISYEEQHQASLNNSCADAVRLHMCTAAGTYRVRSALESLGYLRLQDCRSTPHAPSASRTEQKNRLQAVALQAQYVLFKHAISQGLCLAVVHVDSWEQWPPCSLRCPVINTVVQCSAETILTCCCASRVVAHHAHNKTSRGLSRDKQVPIPRQQQQHATSCLRGVVRSCCSLLPLLCRSEPA